MKQYEIKENNPWDGETSSYLVDLDEDTFNKINTLFNTGDHEDTCNIKESNYSKEDIESINKKSNNIYVDRIGYYKLEDDLNFANLGSISIFPFRGSRLIKI